MFAKQKGVIFMVENRISQFTFDEIEEKLGTIKKDQGADKVLLGDGTYADISDVISSDVVQDAVDKSIEDNFSEASDGEIDNLFA